jgi:type III polyketide synthase
MPRHNKLDALYITGLAHEYPPHTVTQEQFGDYVERLYPDAAASPG